MPTCISPLAVSTSLPIDPHSFLCVQLFPLLRSHASFPVPPPPDSFPFFLPVPYALICGIHSDCLNQFPILRFDHSCCFHILWSVGSPPIILRAQLLMCPIDPFLFRVQIYYIATRLKKEILRPFSIVPNPSTSGNLCFCSNQLQHCSFAQLLLLFQPVQPSIRFSTPINFCRMTESRALARVAKARSDWWWAWHLVFGFNLCSSNHGELFVSRKPRYLAGPESANSFNITTRIFFNGKTSCLFVGKRFFAATLSMCTKQLDLDEIAILRRSYSSRVAASGRLGFYDALTRLIKPRVGLG